MDIRAKLRFDHYYFGYSLVCFASQRGKRPASWLRGGRRRGLRGGYSRQAEYLPRPCREQPLRVSRPGGRHWRPLARGLHPLGDCPRAPPRCVRTGCPSPFYAARVPAPPLCGVAQLHCYGSYSNSGCCRGLIPGGVGYRRLGTGSASRQLLTGSRCMVGIVTEPLALARLPVQFILCLVFLIASSIRCLKMQRLFSCGSNENAM